MRYIIAMAPNPSSARTSRWAIAPFMALVLATGLGCFGPAPAAPAAPAPALYAISPSVVTVGSPAVVVTLQGEHFTANSRVRWNAADLPTAFVSSTQLRVTVASTLLDTVSTSRVMVYTGPPGGGVSGTLLFGVAAAPPLTWSVSPVTIPGGTFDATVAPNGVAYFSRLFTDSLVRMDVASNSLAATLPVGRWPYEVSFNSTGALAYTTHLQASSIGIVNTSSGALTGAHVIDAEPIRVRVAAADSLLFVTTVQGTLLTLHAATGAEVRAPTLVGGVLNGLALTPDGSRLWLSNTTGAVQEVHVADGTLGRDFLMHGRPQDIAISNDGSLMYISNEEGWIGVYNLATLERVDSLSVPVPFGIALNRAGSQLWVASGSVGLVHVFDTKSRVLAGTINVGGRPRHIAFTSDGVALVANESNISHLIRQNLP